MSPCIENNLFQENSSSFTHRRELMNSYRDTVLEAARMTDDSLFIAIDSKQGFSPQLYGHFGPNTLCCGDCPVPRGLFSSAPGLWPLDAVSTPPRL